ncbi:MAG: TIGR02253 family HAD-type hydrolase [Nanoarchaeota archaeon]|nr:TIGR02253 family HAD-type hydrolase [Nanoarchaeota archaeon]MBU4242488.1 TIGR02253 family HAD-type hydrolase [Nanoarchaeota archaeon]MBU4351800.1 TIGR02253 family HAD-type hydrolase [Nanoarchaeota archaeon]MBU4456201.1 TIGR02253 family HAD-type hydrolase [Nanoarchaeota archaeon]
MIKAIIFDLDNTIVDFWKMKTMSIEAAVSAMIDAGLQMNHAEATAKLFRIYKVLGYEYYQIFEEFLKKEIGKIDYKMLANAIVAYRRVRDSFLEPYPGVLRTLLELKQKGLKLGILTDASRLNAWIRLTTMKLDDFFDVVVTFDDTKRIKPHKFTFDKVLKELKVEASEVLMVGDNIDRDILGASKLGMKTCFAKYGHDSNNLKTKNKIKADYDILRFEDILTLI